MNSIKYIPDADMWTSLGKCRHRRAGRGAFLLDNSFKQGKLQLLLEINVR